MQIIRKDPRALRAPPHFADYDHVRAASSWPDLGRKVNAPDGRCKIGYLAADRHAEGPTADRLVRGDHMFIVTGRVPELNFLIGLSKQYDVKIPEPDYANLRTIDDIVAYLYDRIAA